MPLFSVIVPHYNSVPQLNRLIEIIPVDNGIQLIVIDDRSTEDISDVETAVGKWLVFADTDDYFLDGAFDTMKRYRDSAAHFCTVYMLT